MLTYCLLTANLIHSTSWKNIQARSQHYCQRQQLLAPLSSSLPLCYQAQRERVLSVKIMKLMSHRLHPRTSHKQTQTHTHITHITQPVPQSFLFSVTVTTTADFQQCSLTLQNSTSSKQEKNHTILNIGKGKKKKEFIAEDMEHTLFEEYKPRVDHRSHHRGPIVTKGVRTHWHLMHVIYRTISTGICSI